MNTKPHRAPITITLSPDAIARLRRYAESHGMSVSASVEALIRKATK